MTKYWKILIPLLFALAIVLGLLQRHQDSYFGFNKKTFYKQTTNPNKSLVDYFQESQNLVQQNPQSLTVTFLAVGDIMLSRNVAAAIKKANNPLLPFSEMADTLKSVNFSFGNLESMFSGSDYFNPSGSMLFNAPKMNIKGLIDYKFKIINLANNHALDQGLKGLEYTLKYLDENNLKYVGVGKDQDEAWQTAIIEINGIKIGFIGTSYASINDNGKTTNAYVARMEDIENLKLKIENLKSLCDFVVVSMHAGTEYTRTPNQKQIAFAHTAIDVGADLVIGHHPHWIQTIEKYKNKYIFYSLGNFIFDQMWSGETKEGLVLKIQISKYQISNNSLSSSLSSSSPSLKVEDIRAEGLPPLNLRGGENAVPPATAYDLQGTRIPVSLDKIELIPVIIENYSTPRPANEEETKNILEKINQKEKILF